MEKFEINNFKAFNSRIAILPTATHKNVLIYGENGAGKTSLYDAMLLAFYHEKLLRPHLSVGAQPEQRANEERDFYNGFNHRTPAGVPSNDFSIKINQTDFKSLNKANYQCFMVSMKDLDYVTHEINDGKVVEKDTINLKQLLEKMNFPSFDVDDYLANHINELLQNVNQSLHDDFIEWFEIGRENVKYDIFIKDDSMNLKESNGLRNVFNEAKINLVVILVLLHSVLLLQAAPADSKHKLLVLDDLVSSLDNSNRLYLARFILSKFTGFQKVLFTHSIGFNNMLYKCIDERGELGSWLTYNLYLTNLGPQIYDFGELKKTGDIKQEYNKGYLQPNTVGNEIRKRFEAGIYELAKIIQIGEVHRATNLVARLVTPGPIYIKKHKGKLYDANDLVKAIKDIADGTDTPADKVHKITDEIQKYSTNADLQKIISFVKEFQFYEKMIIHSLSHGSAPMPNFNQKEVESAMNFLETIENEINSFKNNVGPV